MRRFFSVGALAVGAAVLVLVAIQSPRARAEDESQIRHGFASVPAGIELNLRGKNRGQVGLGAYLVNTIGDCNGCHSKEFNPYLDGGNPYAGEEEKIDPDRYLVGGSEFFPGATSRNLRPENGLPAGLTLSQFVDAFRNGTDHSNPGQLLDVMPWPSFSKMTDHDIVAIYEYLSCLPPKP